MEWLIRSYMSRCRIGSYQELSDRTGIAYQTLRRRIHTPKTLTVYEIRALNDVLNFDESDLLKIAKGET